MQRTTLTITETPSGELEVTLRDSIAVGASIDETETVTTTPTLWLRIGQGEPIPLDFAALQRALHGDTRLAITPAKHA